MTVTNGWLQPRDSEFMAILRSLSIFVIVFGHVGGFWFYPPWSEFLHVFVAIFFFLTGAVSYNAYLKRTSATQYLKKRVIGLLVPYYLICIVALVVFLVQHANFPNFNLINLIKWATITPSYSIMPFPLGQVWFLHTLMIICLASPIFFWLYQRYFYIFILFLISSMIASAIQINYHIAPFFGIAGINLFKPFIHVVFFCVGFMVIDIPKLRSFFLSSAIVALGIIISIVLVGLLNINPNYANHTYYPDFYYMAGSLSAIWFFLLLQSSILKLYDVLPGLFQNTSHFFFRHTFAIYLLHSFSVFFVENIFGLVHPQQKTISYGIIKLVLVLAITLSLSPLFTKTSSLIGNQILIFRGVKQAHHSEEGKS